MHRSIQRSAAALGDDHPVRPGSLRCADNCPQVVGILNLVADNQKGSRALFPGNIQKILQGHIGSTCSRGNDPLVGSAIRHLAQLLVRYVLHHDAPAFRKGTDSAQASSGAVHIYGIKRFFRLQCFQNRVPPDDERFLLVLCLYQSFHPPIPEIPPRGRLSIFMRFSEANRCSCSHTRL